MLTLNLLFIARQNIGKSLAGKEAGVTGTKRFM